MSCGSETSVDMDAPRPAGESDVHADVMRRRVTRPGRSRSRQRPVMHDMDLRHSDLIPTAPRMGGLGPKMSNHIPMQQFPRQIVDQRRCRELRQSPKLSHRMAITGDNHHAIARESQRGDEKTTSARDSVRRIVGQLEGVG
jgi:hypothetical protein